MARTSSTYHQRGNKLTHTLPMDSGGSQTETWTYDQYNRVVTHADLDGNTTWELYENSPQFGGYAPGFQGRLIAEYRYTGSFTPPPGSGVFPDQTNWSERTLYVYDDGATAGSSDLQSSELTHQGRVAEVQEWTNANGTATETDVTHTTFDPITGQPSSITSDEGTVNYAYDPATGNKVRMWTGTDPDNAPDDTAYAYDSQGRLTDVYSLVLDGTRYATFSGIDPTTHNPTFTGTPLDTHYTYDAAGNLKTESQPDQTTTTYTYDDLNRLTDLSTENTSTNEPVFAEHYDLNLDGSRKDVVDARYNADGTLFSQTETDWQYDAIDRLTSESLTVLDDGTGGTSDANGHAPQPYTDTFAFDLDGNRVQELFAQGVDAAGDPIVTEHDYTYNADNELKTESVPDAYRITDGYDNAGNLISQVRTGTDPETDSYTWDLRGRMASATVNGIWTTYTYDSDGVRTSETTNGTTTYYLNDPTNPTGYAKAVEQWVSASGRANASLGMAYVLGVQVEGQAGGSGGTLFPLHDGHGSTRAVLNTSGGVVEQYNYDAYGDLLASTGAQASAADALTSWLFAGDGEYDANSDLTYHLQRWREGFHFTGYDPAIFAPGDLANSNLYCYCHGSPIDWLDPNGHNLVTTLGVVGLIAGLIGLTGLTFFSDLYAHAGIRQYASPRYLSGTAGPDITSNLLSMRAHVFSFVNKNATNLNIATNSFGHNVAGNWDIPDLRNGTVSTSTADGVLWGREDSVTVAGKVYLQSEANYWLYGSWCRAIGVSKQTMFATISGWRSLVAGSSDVPGREAWAEAGWEGDFSYAEDSEIQAAIPASPGSMAAFTSTVQGGGHPGKLFFSLGSPVFLSGWD